MSVSTVGEALAVFDNYIVDKRDASIVLEDEESGDVCAIPHNHRWTPEYRKMLWRKLDRARRFMEQKWTAAGNSEVPVTWVTFEPDVVGPGGEPRPHASVLEDLQESWDEFRPALYRACDGRETEYFRFLEPTEYGYPKLSVAVFGVALDSIGDRSAAWEFSPVGGVFERIKSALRKATDEVADNPFAWDGYRAFSALLWATGARQYSASAGLSSAMSGSSSSSSAGAWVYRGTARGIRGGVYSGEEAEQLRGHLFGAVWKPPPSSAMLDSSAEVRQRAVTP